MAQDEGEAASRRTSVLEEVGEGTVSKEQVALLEKEVREQEGLLAGYQVKQLDGRFDYCSMSDVKK